MAWLQMYARGRKTALFSLDTPHLQLVVVGSLVIATSAARAIELGGDGVSDVRQLLELLVKVLRGRLSGVLLEPVLGLLDGVLESLLVIIVNLATETLLVVDLVLQAVGVVLELIARLNALAVGLVLLGVLLGFLDHALNVLSAQAALVVGDGDALSLTGALVDSGNLEDTVGVELESDLNLGNTTGRGAVKRLARYLRIIWKWESLRNVGQLELSKVVAATRVSRRFRGDARGEGNTHLSLVIVRSPSKTWIRTTG